MRKVIVRLGNGLGNQLFTYAAAFTFARKNNAKLYVDDESGFYKRYKYEMHNLNISADIVEKKYKFLGFNGRLKRKLLKAFNHYSKNKIFLIEEIDKNKLTYYNSDQFKINFEEKLYFEGYFQSEKYFDSEKPNLLKEFTFKSTIVNQKNSFINLIKNTNSVSIHVRQEKFTSIDQHKNLDKLNSEFLDNNIDIIKKGIYYFDKSLEKPEYFVWSNNFTGLRQFFTSEKFTFVDENIYKDAAYDLYLMSQCKHFILSPSTMHYWAAYFSPNNNKICLAPKNIRNRSGYYGFSNNRDIRAEWWKEI